MPLPAAALLPLFLAAAAAASPAPSPPRGGAWTFHLPGEVSLTSRWVPPGEFPMGSPGDEFGRREDEGPRHAVTLTRGCWMGACEVTQAQWRAVMGTEPWKGVPRVTEQPDAPAVMVSWDDARAFTARLGELTGAVFRLPTEAEWERACRAGAAAPYAWGDDPEFEAIEAHAWWRRNALNVPDPGARAAGRKAANRYGLFDLSGNVFEWCADWYAPYAEGPLADPAGPAAGTQRVNRGGGWMSLGTQCRAACRGRDVPSARYEDLGFRVAADPLPAQTAGALRGAPVTRDVFVAGRDGVDTYRIPAVTAAADGTLLVFCEARKQSMADASPTDMVLRRSRDGGDTWLPMQTLARGEGSDALMNPCPILDRDTGALLLVFMRANSAGENRNTLLTVTSADHGETWSAPQELSPRVSGYLDTFVPGPGAGIQTRTGRLIVPGYAGEWSDETKAGMHARVLRSDDHGATWTLGAPVPEYTDESAAAELDDGTLLLNARGDMGTGCRAVARSGDGGATWSSFRWDPQLNECPCQAALLRYGPGCLLFSNPDNRGDSFGAVERTRMTVRVSWDNGASWPLSRLIHAGPSSYSGLAALPGGNIGLVYEGGETHRREWIRFARFSLEWLTDGASGPSDVPGG